MDWHLVENTIKDLHSLLEQWREEKEMDTLYQQNEGMPEYFKKHLSFQKYFEFKGKEQNISWRSTPKVDMQDPMFIGEGEIEKNQQGDKEKSARNESSRFEEIKEISKNKEQPKGEGSQSAIVDLSHEEVCKENNMELADLRLERKLEIEVEETPLPHEICLVDSQYVCFVMHIPTYVEDVDDMIVVKEYDKCIEVSTSVCDDGLDYQTMPMDRNVHDSFSFFYLENKFHNEYTISKKKRHQPLDTWDPGILAPKYDELVWNEFPFEQEIVSALSQEICKEYVMKLVDFDPDDRSELLLQKADFDQKIDGTSFEEEIFGTWDSREDIVERYEINSDFDMSYNNSSLV